MTKGNKIAIIVVGLLAAGGVAYAINRKNSLKPVSADPGSTGSAPNVDAARQELMAWADRHVEPQYHDLVKGAFGRMSSDEVMASKDILFNYYDKQKTVPVGTELYDKLKAMGIRYGIFAGMY